MNLRRRRTVLIGLVLLPALLVACGKDEEQVVSKVFVGPPWQSPETLSYNLSRRGEPSLGTCTLKTEPEFEPGKTRLSQRCGNEQHTDEATTIVESSTLNPLLAIRTASDAEKNRRTVWTNTYEETTVRFEAETNGSRSQTERDLPEATKLSPDPGWYEDSSLLWLVRGITLRDGYVAGYMHVINAGQPRILPVEVTVRSAETVTVPAGQFTAWRVAVRREGTTYAFWVDQASPQRVVRARIEDVIYELIESR